MDDLEIEHHDLFLEGRQLDFSSLKCKGKHINAKIAKKGKTLFKSLPFVGGSAPSYSLWFITSVTQKNVPSAVLYYYYAWYIFLHNRRYVFASVLFYQLFRGRRVKKLMQIAHYRNPQKLT